LHAQARLQLPSARLTIHDLARRNGHAEFAEDVRKGFTATPKRLFPKYLYDELGSQLFEAICRLDEYYLMRAENEILSEHADEIVHMLPDCDTLVELGSGSAEKTRLIIEAVLRQRSSLLFVPIDISTSALKKSCSVLLQAYPQLQIRAYAADYFDGLSALQPLSGPPLLMLFLGSNIGNFEKAGAVNFLCAIRRVLRKGDALLLGADLKKDRAALEAAYNDRLGVTRAFILNELARVNRELGGEFDLRTFDLKSIYDEAAGRVDVYLESKIDQAVSIQNLQLQLKFTAGERIHMENAYKYSREELSALASASGFDFARSWLDRKQRFSSNLFVAA
jgi:dimethylhistidine N-methyltransferase